MVHRYRVLWFSYAALGGAFSLPQAHAAECNYTPAKIALHLTAPTSKGTPCGQVDIPCSQENGLVVTGEVEQEYTAYVLLTDWSGESGIQQVQIGANYDALEGSGVDVISFQSCGTFNTTPIGPWPEPGSEVVMSWSSCQVPDGNKLLMLGSFQLVAHSPGIFSVAKVFAPTGPHTVPRLVDCEGTEKLIEPNKVSQLAFGEPPFPSFDTCSGVIDVFPAPCCVADSCISQTGLACCWANGGTLLDYMASCAACVTPAIPRTWGYLKSRYE